ncbi:MAG: mannose-6-phosphate isomerase [Flavobacteriaceae bacterium]|nr:mannose-6-phosphate isomerase [Flavobacteriaceae bacterium]
MGKSKLYPLKFHPQLKEKVWGGSKLVSVLGKKGKGKLGESWELSGVKNNISIVANGALNGENLNMLIEEYGTDLLGEAVLKKYGKEFPLLFKFIDAREDLSVQLHPDDEVAKQRHNSFGKTEMWYIQQADKDARLILGFNQKMDKETYLQHLSKKAITKILHAEKVQKGDAFFIAPGTVHAIGAGVLLAEIQQTSDITYRIYDWDRPDVDGSMRELHTDLALDVISFEKSDAKLKYSVSENETTPLCTSDYFETNIVKLTKPIQKDISKIDSFMVYMCVEGNAIINGEPIKLGETLLLPACFQHIHIETEAATLLEVYVP